VCSYRRVSLALQDLTWPNNTEIKQLDDRLKIVLFAELGKLV